MFKGCQRPLSEGVLRELLRIDVLRLATSAHITAGNRLTYACNEGRK